MQKDGKLIIIIDPFLSVINAYEVLLHECGHHRDWGPAKVSLPRISQSGKLTPLGAALVGVTKSIYDINAELWALRWDRWARAKAGSDLVVDKLRILKHWNVHGQG